MPDQIPPGCADLKNHPDLLNRQYAQAVQNVSEADSADKPRFQKLAGQKQHEVQVAKAAFENCLANPPVVIPPEATVNF